MKSIIAEIDRMTNLLAEIVNTGNVDGIMPVLSERFKLMSELLKIKDSSDYLTNLVERDKIIMKKIKEQQTSVSVYIENMNKLSRYRL